MPSVSRRPRARKPHKDFPLFKHARGYWAKKVRGETRYFGKIADDPKGQAALAQWLDQKDDLLAGRTPRAKRDGLTIEKLCDDLLNFKRPLVASGELTQRTFDEYIAAGNRLIDTFGASRLVDDLQADDFAVLRAGIAKQWGLARLSKTIQLVRTIFKFGFEAGLIDRPIRYGDTFRKPTKKTLRKHRAANEQRHGKRMFEPEQLRGLIAAAGPQFRAMLLLAINAGYGNTDCATLPLSAVNFKSEFAEFARPKTGVDRRCPLWRETLDALKVAIEKRPTPKAADCEHRLFVTKSGGSWAKETSDNPISKAMTKLLKQLGLHRPGLGFYAIRHSFQTIAEKTLDKDAVRYIMGHSEAANDMSAVYSEERSSDDRLRSVTDHVHRWLYGGSRCDFANGKL